MSYNENCPICKVKTSGFLCDPCQESQLAKIETIVIEVPMKEYLEYSKLISCEQMGKNKAKGVITRRDGLYVVTGAVGGGGHKHWTKLCAHKVVPLELHDGPTYNYNQLGRVNGTGGWFHSNNQKFKTRGKEYVIVPYVEIIFLPIEGTLVVQNALF